MSRKRTKRFRVCRRCKKPKTISSRMFCSNKCEREWITFSTGHEDFSAGEVDQYLADSVKRELSPSWVRHPLPTT